MTQDPKPNQLELKWLMDAYKKFPKSDTFFLKGFNRIVGNSSLKKQIISGVSEIEIRKSWKSKLEDFKEIRKKYLIYH